MNALEVDRISYRYDDGTNALNGVSFSVAAGECVGIIGPNGAGKSTLLLHLNGVLPEKLKEPSGINVGGIPLTRKTVYEIRRRVGLLFQDADDQLFCPTVYDDVAYGPTQFGIPAQEIDDVVKKSLASVGLSGYESRSPHHLSGGEKQRVCLAGILACEPEILVLDEPTSNLDPRHRRALRNLLTSLKRTMIIATHDLELVVYLCSRVLILDHGAIVAEGPTIEILSNEKLMEEHGLEKPHILQHLHPHR